MTTQGGISLDKLNEQEYQERIQRAVELLLSEPQFPNRENIPFIKAVRTYYSTLKSWLDEGFSFEQILRSLEREGFLPQNSKTNSLRQAYYRETARRKKAIEAGYDPAPWDKKTNQQGDEVQNDAALRNS
jgi:hypothetical protein